MDCNEVGYIYKSNQIMTRDLWISFLFFFLRLFVEFWDKKNKKEMIFHKEQEVTNHVLHFYMVYLLHLLFLLLL